MERYGIGQPVRRIEDRRLVVGRGRFVDDESVENVAHLVVVRSPHAHARIVGIDTAAAAAAPGVLAVLTGREWAEDGLGTIPTRTQVKNKDGSPPATPPRPGLCTERVRFVGDAVALVVAETRAAAKDAAEMVEVAYEPLPAVVDSAAALAPGAPLVWEEIPGNLCVDFEAGDPEATEAAIRNAPHVVRLELVNNRVTAVPIEPRGALGLYDAEADRFTLICATQNIHANRNQLAKDVLRIPPEHLRQVAYDVGGGFGAKNALYPEHAFVLFAARRVGRPVKWINDRSESFLSDTHGRDQKSTVELALDEDGRFLALRVVSTGDVGAYVSSIGPFTPTGGSARTQGGPYRLPTGAFLSRAAFTNTAPTDPYRGAGRPEATYQIERVIDYAAAELGLDPLELRRRNVLRRDELPWRTPYGAEIDCGDFPAVLERTLELIDWDGFPERAAAARTRGRRRGIGIGLYFECSGGAPREYASLAFAHDGRIALAVGSQSTGMGHETSLAQIVAERLGVPLETIAYHQADTDLTPVGGGHGGSRGMEMGGSAVAAVADKVIAKARRIAAHLLEAAEADIEFGEGRFVVVGTDRTVTMSEVIRASFDPANLPEGLEGGLDDEAVYERDSITYPNGCHIAEVEVDPETGVVEIVDYAIVDDFGRLINPLTADGQVMGGTAQGIGQALLEEIVYDGEGQLLTGSLMDYALPRADDLPAFRTAFFEGAPSPKNPLGVKGAGEAGCCGAPPAIVNAVVNALAEYGVRHIDMPLTPEKVWRAIRAAAGDR